VIDALLATLERAAEEEIARILAAARARAAALAEEAEERVGRRRKEALGRREEERRGGVERAVAAARHTARLRVLTARERFLARVFAQLEQALPPTAAGAAYRASRASAIARAHAFTGGQRAVVRRALTGGFRLVTADGRLEVDCTLAGRVERLRPRLALEALAALSRLS
jgi:vacuolar-type H+-ATPase subunit E/Vma4